MRAVGAALAALVLSACAAGGVGGPSDSPSTSSASSPGASADSSSPEDKEETEDAPEESDPDVALSWGPTAGELATAQELVAGWSPEQLAGGVIVGRFFGTDPAVPAALVRDLHLAGVSVTSDNVADARQVAALNGAVARAAEQDGRSYPPVIGVDQEGGYVSHLRGVATDFPPFESTGLAIQADRRRGREVTRDAARAAALELRSYGFTWVFAPVADVTIGAADPTIGTRSPSSDPQVAATATVAAVRGYNEAGLVSTLKHFPGHGTATEDSHETLPRVDSTMAEIEAHDLPPFVAAVAERAPAVMMSHLDLSAIAPGVPASMAPQVYDLLREDVGFEGVAITDSLGMGAVAGRPKPAVQALLAGADLLLMPVDTRRTHRIITDAIASGEVPRERAEEAAARVVAVQLWQQRVAGEVPVPPDVATRAQAAAAALRGAAY